MRQAHLLLLLPPLALAPLACVEDATSPTPVAPVALDGGPRDSGVDATILDGAPPVDAADAADAAPPIVPDADAGPQPVTVTVLRKNLPVVGVTVVFGDAAGAVIEALTTDAAGRVARLVPAGSQVTTILGTATQPELVTVTGVEPGDVLTTIDRSFEAFPIIKVTSVPPSPPSGTISYYLTSGRCATRFTAVPANHRLRQECVAGGTNTYPVLVEARNAQSAATAYAYKKNNPLAPDGGIPDGGLQLDIDGSWLVIAANETVVAANIPDGGVGSLSLTELAGGVAHPQFENFSDTDGGFLSPEFAVHSGFVEGVQREANLRESKLGGSVYRAIASRGAPPTTSATTNFDLAQLLPEITEAKLEVATAERPAATWKTATPIATADGTLVQFRWSALRGDAGDRVSGRWTIVASGSVTTVTAPALPASAADRAPPLGAFVGTPPVVAIVESASIDGYRGLRPRAAALHPTETLLNSNSGPVIPPLPVDGIFKLTAITEDRD